MLAEYFFFTDAPVRTRIIPAQAVDFQPHGTPGYGLAVQVGNDRPLDEVRVECRVVHDSPELESRLNKTTEDGPRVQHWPEVSPERSVLHTARLDTIDFLGPNQLLTHQSLDGQSGTELGFSLNRLRVWVTANVKADGYLVMKIFFGTEVHQYTTDARVRGGQTLVLAGWGTSDELLLVTVKILPKPED